MELKGHGGTKKRSPEEDKRKEIADYVWQLWIYERSPPPPQLTQEILGETYFRELDILQDYRETEITEI